MGADEHDAFVKSFEKLLAWDPGQGRKPDEDRPATAFANLKAWGWDSEQGPTLDGQPVEGLTEKPYSASSIEEARDLEPDKFHPHGRLLPSVGVHRPYPGGFVLAVVEHLPTLRWTTEECAQGEWRVLVRDFGYGFWESFHATEEEARAVLGAIPLPFKPPVVAPDSEQ